MNVLSIVYPQFWMQPNIDFSFPCILMSSRNIILWIEEGETFSGLGCKTFGY